MKHSPILLFLFFLTHTFLFAQTVPLDATFGTNGLAVLDQGSNAPGRSTMIAVAPDGKILLGGFSLTGIGEPLTLARYQANGTPDGTFGQNGVVQHAKFEGAIKIKSLPNGKTLILRYRGFDLARLNNDGSEDTDFQLVTVPGDDSRKTYNTDFLVQPDGKILVTALHPDAPFSQYCVARFLENGALDTSFGFGGLAHLVPNWVGYSQSIALQPDGKILLTGTASADKISAVRYLPDGTPDPVFGLNGLATWNQAVGEQVFGRGIVAQPDGKILIAANVSDDPQGYVALYRMSAAGLPDSTFGNNGVTISHDLTNIYGLFLQNDGKILCGGLKDGDTDRAGVLRFLPTGAPDNTYTGTNSLSNWEASNDGEPMGFVLQADGKMLAAIPTTSTFAPTDGFLAVRLLPSGLKDPLFNGDGVVYAEYNAGDDRATDVALQPDGKILVIGDTYSDYLDVQTMLARYKPDGTLDATFGSGGKKLFSLNAPNNNYAYAVAVQPDGKVLAAIGFNFGTIELKIVRFNSNGSLDNGFGVNGTVPVPGSFFRVADLILQPDGKILVGGTLQDRKFAVVRLLPNGSPDAGFGSGGTAAVALGTASDYGLCAGFGLLPDGKVIVAGCLPFIGAVVAARFKSNGQLDAGFSGDGKAQFPLADDFYAYSFSVQPDGKILVGGNMVLRIQADGSTLDMGFGTNGVTSFDLGTGASYCNALALLPNDQILCLGKTSSTTTTNLMAVTLLPNGTPAPNGIASADLGYGYADFTKALVQPDGKVVAVGSVRQATDIDFGLFRYVTGVSVGSTEQTLPKAMIVASPNPFGETLQFDFSILPTPARTIAIFDLSGRQVFSVNELAAQKMTLPTVAGWLPGVYLLRVTTDKDIFVQKIIKQ